jgi:hypothetical protein
MRRGLLVGGVSALILAGLITYGIVAEAGASGRGKTLPVAEANMTPAPNCFTLPHPCPTSGPPLTLETERTFADQLKFEPPQTDPVIDNGEAENIAWQQEAAPNALDQQATLALMPAGGNIKEDTLVWIVDYTSSCIPPATGKAGADNSGMCSSDHTWSVVVDATTGDFIIAYTGE